MEAMMEAVMEEWAMEAKLRPERSMRPKEAGAAEVRAHHGSGARAYACANEAAAAEATTATAADAPSDSMPATEAATAADASSHSMPATASHASTASEGERR